MKESAGGASLQREDVPRGQGTFVQRSFGVGLRGLHRAPLLAIRYGLLIVFVLYFAIMSIVSPYFFTSLNLLNVLRQTAPVLISAVGMTFVIATAGIDLSVGSIVALVSVLTADWLRAGLGAWPAVALGLIVGMLTGAL